MTTAAARPGGTLRRWLDAPWALAAGCALMLAVQGSILGRASWSRSAPSPPTVTLTEREAAMPLFRERDDSGLELSLVSSSRLPGVALRAAGWRRIEPPPFAAPWLDDAKLRELGFDAMALADPDPRRSVLPRYAFIVLEYEGDGWKRWLAAEEARVEALRREADAGRASPARADEAEAFLAIDRVSRSRWMPVDAGLDEGRLRGTYPPERGFIVLPGTIGLVTTVEGHAGWVARKWIDLGVERIHVPYASRAALEPFAPGYDGLEFERRLRDIPGTGLPVPAEPRYRVKIAFGRDGRPWLLGVEPIPAPAATPPATPPPPS